MPMQNQEWQGQTEVLSCKKRGMSYEDISKHFYEYNRADISAASVFNWVKGMETLLIHLIKSKSQN